MIPTAECVSQAARSHADLVESMPGLALTGALLGYGVASPKAVADFLQTAVEKWRVKPTFWLPGANIVEKSRADRVQYDVWAAKGLLQTTPGKAIEYEWVAFRLVEEIRGGNIAKIGFDEWNWKFLRPWLIKAGLTEEEVDAIFVPVRQGYKTMSPAFRDLETWLLSEKLAHGGHPVLTMCAANAVLTTDPAGNRKLDKSRAAGRIDGIVALVDAFAVAPAEPSAPVADIGGMIG
jgi:phage terminase large subunit-like protein